MKDKLKNRRYEICVGIAIFIILVLVLLADFPWPPARPSTTDAEVWIAAIVGIATCVGLLLALLQARQTVAIKAQQFDGAVGQVKRQSQEYEEELAQSVEARIPIPKQEEREDLVRHEAVRPLARLRQAIFYDIGTRAPEERGIHMFRIWIDIVHEAGQQGFDVRVMMITRDTEYFDLLPDEGTILRPIADERSNKADGAPSLRFSWEGAIGLEVGKEYAITCSFRDVLGWLWAQQTPFVALPRTSGAYPQSPVLDVQFDMPEHVVSLPPFNAIGGQTAGPSVHQADVE